MQAETIFTDEEEVRPQPLERCRMLPEIVNGWDAIAAALEKTAAAAEQDHTGLRALEEGISSICGDFEDPSLLTSRGFVVIRGLFTPAVREAYVAHASRMATRHSEPLKVGRGEGDITVGQRAFSSVLLRDELSGDLILAPGLEAIEAVLTRWADGGNLPPSWHNRSGIPHTVAADFIQLRITASERARAVAEGHEWPLGHKSPTWHAFDGASTYPNTGADMLGRSRGLHHMWVLLDKEEDANARVTSNLDVIPIDHFERACTRALSRGAVDVDVDVGGAHAAGVADALAPCVFDDRAARDSVEAADFALQMYARGDLAGGEGCWAAAIRFASSEPPNHHHGQDQAGANEGSAGANEGSAGANEGSAGANEGSAGADDDHAGKVDASDHMERSTAIPSQPSTCTTPFYLPAAPHPECFHTSRRCEPWCAHKPCKLNISANPFCDCGGCNAALPCGPTKPGYAWKNPIPTGDCHDELLHALDFSSRGIHFAEVMHRLVEGTVCRPQMDVGDAIFFTDQVLHKTQDFALGRMAMSFDLV